MSSRKAPLPDNDVAALVESLRSVKVGRAGYSRTDRYRDFHRVLHGTPEGKRVLAQVIDLCEGPIVTEADIANHALLAARAWGRRLALLILSYSSVPPIVEPEQKGAHGKLD